MGMLWEFVRYKYSFHEYLYGFMREAQQTPSIIAVKHSSASSTALYISTSTSFEKVNGYFVSAKQFIRARIKS
jgi:hypothetical protein